MSLKIDASTSKVAYHKEDGAITFPYAIDAHHAVAQHPHEWSFEPFLKDGEMAPPEAIPEDWQDMKPLQRIALAAKLGAERKGLTAVKADEVIQAEVDRRETDVAE